jgi:hypothetical protein
LAQADVYVIHDTSEDPATRRYSADRWRSQLDKWEHMNRVVLHDEMREICVVPL